MKTLPLICLATWVASVGFGQTAATSAYEAWPRVQAVQVEKAGLVRLEIPSATQASAQPDLADLRLVNAEGKETPYVVELPTLEALRVSPVASFKVKLEEQRTVVEVDPGQQGVIEALDLQSTSTGYFLKSAQLESSDDGTQWQAAGDATVIFNQPDGSRRLKLPVPPGSGKLLRVIVDDRREAPVVFTGASTVSRQPASGTIAEPLQIEKIEQSGSLSRVVLRLATSHAWLGVIRLKVPSPQTFSRQVSVEDTAAESAKTRLAHARIYRLGVDQAVAETLEIPVHRQVRGNTVTLLVENGSSPPLEIASAETTRYATQLVFQAEAPGSWRLFSGHPTVQAPKYDLTAVQDSLRSMSAVPVTVGAMAAHAEYKKDVALHAFAGSGGALDTRPWRRRKLVEIQATGVQRLPLDLDAVSHSSSGKRDYRLVQEGRQVPFDGDAEHRADCAVDLYTDARCQEAKLFHLESRAAYAGGSHTGTEGDVCLAVPPPDIHRQN